MTEIVINSQDISHGLYYLHWKDGGISEASVGSDTSGNRWYAPTNWTRVPSYDWTNIKKIEKLPITMHSNTTEVEQL